MLTSSGVTYKLSGNIRHMGLPVSGVVLKLVAPHDRQVIEERKTGSRGDFNFAVAMGTYALIVIPDPSTCFVPRIFEEIAVGGNTTLNINLTTGMILKGKLSCAQTIDKSRAEVIVVGFDDNFKQVIAMDKSGQYSLVLPKGRYYVTATSAPLDLKAGSSASEHRASSFLTTQYQLIELERDLVVNPDLNDLCHFKGNVQDGSGYPVAAALITIKPHPDQTNRVISRCELVAKCLSNDAGDFAINIRPGDYDFIIDPPEFAPLAETREEAVYIAPGSTRTFMLNKGFHLSGIVEYEGSPVIDGVVEVKDHTRKWTSLLSTDARGCFSVNVPEGIYEISVVPKVDGKAEKLPAPEKKILSINSDQELKFQLKSGVIVSGFVRDGSGVIRPAVHVNLVPQSATQDNAASSATTNDEGFYQLVVVPGTYIAYLNDDKDKGELLTVGSDGLTTEHVCQGACVIRLKIVSEDEEAIANCHVQWWPYNINESAKGQQQLALFAVDESNLSKGAAITDDHGICQLTLAEGVYTFRFLPSTQGVCDERTIRQLSISGDMKRKVKLPYKTS